MTLLDLFDMCYIINLPERKDRRRQTEKEIAFAFPDADQEKCQFYQAVRPNDPDGFVSIGARGSLLSHLGALRLARKKSVTRVLLLEDDVAFRPWVRDPSLLSMLSERLAQDDWDFLYLGHNIPESNSRGTLATLEAYTKGICGAHCMAFSARMLDTFIAYLESTLVNPPGHPDGGRMGFDGATNLYRARNPVTTLALMPAVATQRSSRTDLGKEKWFDRTPVLRGTAQAGRDLLTWCNRLGRTRRL